MDNKKIVVPDCNGNRDLYNLFCQYQESLDIKVYLYPPNDEDEFVERIKDRCIVIHYFKGFRISSSVLNKVSGIRLIVIAGPAGNCLDRKEAVKLGIDVSDAPGMAVNAVAEFNLALIFALSRNLIHANESFTSYQWCEVFGREIAGKTIGIVGYGRIGRKIGDFCSSLGLKVIYWNRVKVKRENNSINFAELPELFKNSDIITVQLRLNESTKNIISAELLDLMKSDVIFINTARAELVDQEKLYDILEKNIRMRSALDVFLQEPLEDEHPLRKLKNVILTSHIAWMTKETLERLVISSMNKVMERNL